MNRTIYTDTARSHNSDPETSHIAAEKMNRGDNLKNNQMYVLDGINKFSGLDAQSIGVEVAHERTGLSRDQIREVMRLIRPFEKRTPELASMGLVDRDKKGDKLIVSINDAGLMRLNRR